MKRSKTTQKGSSKTRGSQPRKQRSMGASCMSAWRTSSLEELYPQMKNLLRISRRSPSGQKRMSRKPIGARKLWSVLVTLEGAMPTSS